MIQSFGGFLRRHVTWETWQFLFIICSLSWLLGPSIAHVANTQTSYISHFEDGGAAWTWLFRTFDVIAAGLLAAAAYGLYRRGGKLSASHKWSFYLLFVISAGMAIDALFPSSCAQEFCIAPGDLSHAIHTVESVITTSALIGLNALWARQAILWSRTVLVLQILTAGWLVAANYHSLVGTTLVQFCYQIIITLWLAELVPHLAGSRRRFSTARRFSIQLIAGWIFLNGVIAIASALVNFQAASHLSRVYFGGNTAWLSQHGVATGIALMMISRHLWRNEHRAWQLTSLLLWLEAVKYALVTPNALYTLLFGLTAALLFSLQRNFNRYTNVDALRVRLKQFVFVALTATVALLIGVALLKASHHQDVDDAAFDILRFFRHLFLVDIANDLGPQSRRLVDQTVNFAGLSILVAFIVSLFKPRRLEYSDTTRLDRRQLYELLQRHSNSSEDFFKYWPSQKHYWWNESRTAAVAYQVVGNVAFALADPVATSARLRTTAQQE
jgi:hypothetical protein